MSALSPSVIAEIDDLELVARLVVEGSRAGSHRSPFHGYSIEFQQHRPYRAGDDLKYLDWKLLARTDRLYSRQFRDTTSMSVMIALDSSASMDYPAEGVSKFRYACIVAASLAYLVSSQGDSVGLIALNGGRMEYMPARGGRPHLRSLLARIDAMKTGGSWEPDRVVARGAELMKRRGILLVVSDFYDAEELTRREVLRAFRRGHDVSLLQVVSAPELDFSFRGEVEFEDLETGERRIVDAESLRPGYRTAATQFVERCRHFASRNGLDYSLLRTDSAPGVALRHYLLRRELLHDRTTAAAVIR